jgi:hypothetical protein
MTVLVRMSSRRRTGSFFMVISPFLRGGQLTWWVGLMTVLVWMFSSRRTDSFLTVDTSNPFS